MTPKSIARRDVLKCLALGGMAGPLTRAIPLEAARYAHQIVEKEKTGTGTYQPKYFTAAQYKTLQALCQAIIPADGESGGALEAGAPEFIDLVTSENDEYQLKLGGGLGWLDAVCTDRFGHNYLGSSAAEREQILNLIAYRKNAASDPRLSPGIEFFFWLRALTVDGYFTSAIGIKYLGYIGNTYLREFPGCPPVPAREES